MLLIFVFVWIFPFMNGTIPTSNLFTETLPWYCSDPRVESPVYVKYVEEEGAISSDKILHSNSSHRVFTLQSSRRFPYLTALRLSNELNPWNKDRISIFIYLSI
jgi:hypothetical protein